MKDWGSKDTNHEEKVLAKYFQVSAIILFLRSVSDRIILRFATMDITHQDECDKHRGRSIEKNCPKAKEVNEGPCYGRRYYGSELAEEIVEAGIDPYSLERRHLPEHRETVGDN